MVAACPFPANHGTPAAIKEMSEELARRGHSIRVVTYPLSHDIPVTGIEIDRVAHVGWNREVNVGPSYQRLVFDAMLVVKLFPGGRQCTGAGEVERVRTSLHQGFNSLPHHKVARKEREKRQTWANHPIPKNQRDFKAPREGSVEGLGLVAPAARARSE
jgi:hypothetical protein